MSNLSSRVRYDESELSLFDKTNKDANSILLDESVKENMSACYAPAGSRGAQSEMTRTMEGFKLNFGLKADVENRLMNRNYELNNNKGRTNKDYMTNNGTAPRTCPTTKETLTNEDSRFTNPVVNYREMYTAPYAFTPYLYISPQVVVAENNNFMTPDRYGESSRVTAKTEKYSLKPKQFATIDKPIDYVQLYKNLVPTRTSGESIPPPYSS